MAVVNFVFPIMKSMVENTLRIIQGIVDVFVGVLTGDWSRAWNGIKNIVGGVLDAIELLLRTAVTVLATVAGLIGSAIKKGVVDGVTGTASAVWDLINNIGGLVAQGMDTIRGWGASVGNWIKDATVDALVGIGSAAWGVIDNIGSVLRDVSGTIRGWGTSVATWIKNAVVDGLEGIGNAIWGVLKRGWDWAMDKLKSLPGVGSLIGDARDPNFTVPPGGGNWAPGGGGVDLMGALPSMMPFAVAAQGVGLRVTSGLRPGAITANGTPSDHGIGKALDVAGPASGMAAFFNSLLGNSSVKQAFYDPLGSIFGGRWSSYREGGHSDHVHVATYDKGGWLKPGLTLAYNGTGSPERVGGRGDVHLHFHGDMYGQPPRQFFKQVRDGLRELDMLQTGGRVLGATPTLS
jgi:hypothetical protein